MLQSSSNRVFSNTHNLTSKLLHKYLLQKYKIKAIEDPYYKFKPDTVNERQNFKVYLDRSIVADKTKTK